MREHIHTHVRTHTYYTQCSKRVHTYSIVWVGVDNVVHAHTLHCVDGGGFAIVCSTCACAHVYVYVRACAFAQAKPPPTLTCTYRNQCVVFANFDRTSYECMYIIINMYVKYLYTCIHTCIKTQNLVLQIHKSSALL